MKQPPGYLQPVYSANEWLSLIYKTDLTPLQKLVATVISRTCNYSTRCVMQLSDISYYSISRIIKANSEEVKVIIDELLALGWLHDTGLTSGARKKYGLTFSLIPLGTMRT